MRRITSSSFELRWAQTISEVPTFFGDRSPSFFGDLSQSLCLLGLRPRRLSVPLFSLWVEELSFLDMRAFSPLIYFSAFASTTAMFSWEFLEMENIKSFD